jgi:hypothetical protein
MHACLRLLPQPAIKLAIRAAMCGICLFPQLIQFTLSIEKQFCYACT